MVVGYTYLREAVAPNINGVITFRASLQIARKPKYFLGIKIHRAIMEISWELTAEYSDTEVVDIIQFDPEKSETEKKDEVNSRLSEIAREYPSCKISTEYFRSEPPETDNTGRYLSPAMVVRPAGNRPPGTYKAEPYLCRPGIAGENDALQALHCGRAA